MISSIKALPRIAAFAIGLTMGCAPERGSIKIDANGKEVSCQGYGITQTPEYIQVVQPMGGLAASYTLELDSRRILYTYDFPPRAEARPGEACYEQVASQMKCHALEVRNHLDRFNCFNAMMDTNIALELVDDMIAQIKQNPQTDQK
ncbi:MAG: hypothetical protein WC624_01830 [Candidatus Margulisiibacteriota bacterium]